MPYTFTLCSFAPVRDANAASQWTYCWVPFWCGDNQRAAPLFGCTLESGVARDTACRALQNFSRADTRDARLSIRGLV